MFLNIVNLKTYFSIGFVFITLICYSQNQKKADSLINVLNSSKSLHDTTRMVIIWNVMVNHTNQNTILQYGNQAYNLAKKAKNSLWLYKILIEIGYAHKLKGNLEESLKALLEALKEVQLLKNEREKREAIVYGAIASVYRVEKDYKRTLEYYNLAIKKLRESNDSLALAGTLMNVGEFYRINNQLDTALIYFTESSSLYKISNYHLGSAYNLGNIGLVYAEQGNHNLAKENINKAIEILTELGDFYPIAVYDTYMADIYLEKGDFDRALQYAQHSLTIATDHGLKEQIRDASLKLAELHEFKEEYQKAFEYQKQYLAYRDSINNEETVRKMADLRTEYEVSQKQTEIDLLENKQQIQKITFASMSTIIVLLAFLAFMYYRNNKRKQMLNIIITERKEEVEAQRDQLEAMNETREKFLSIIAHDLLGPVNSFKGFSTIMKFSIDQNDTEDLKQIHSQFEKSVDGLSSLLTNLLDWSVTQQGSIPYKPQKTELKTLVDELVNLFKNMADTKNIEIKSTIDTDVDMWVDVNSVKTILRNLVSNAIKFTVDGGSITISAQTDGSMVNVKVQDTGIGIPQEKLATLLGENNFNRSWGTKGEKGLGLGLQLVKEFTQINKGELAIESVEGKGTSISVTLPLFISKTQQ
ncbi:MAG: tetratricopeptide repeat-containing sensor histidine kinase [Fulvivirga sp.]